MITSGGGGCGDWSKDVVECVGAGEADSTEAVRWVRKRSGSLSAGSRDSQAIGVL